MALKNGHIVQSQLSGSYGRISSEELTDGTFRVDWSDGQYAYLPGVQLTAVAESLEALATRGVDLAERAANLKEAELQEEFLAWKRNLGSDALELAAEHGWCNVVTEFLENHDVPLPSKTVKFTLRVEYEITAEAIEREHFTLDPSVLKDAVSYGEGDEGVSIYLSEDYWKNVWFRYANAQVWAVEHVTD